MKINYIVAILLSMSLGATAMGKDQNRKIQVYAHRGGRSYSPENTMPAYRATLKMGADWVDMDVVMTKEGEIVIGHDPLLNPDIVRDANGKFIAASKEAFAKYSSEQKADFVAHFATKNMTLVELQKFDVGRLNSASAYAKLFPDQFAVDGTHMPTLLEVVRWVNKQSKNRLGFQIEMKTDPTAPELSSDPKLFAEMLYKILHDEKIIDRAEIQAFDFRCLHELQKLNPHVRSAYLTSTDNEKGGVDDFFSNDSATATRWTGGPQVKDYGNSIPKMVKALGGFAWEPEDQELTLASFKEAKALGLKVVVWTWPEKSGKAFDGDVVAKLIDWGIDGIITDDPGRLVSMLAARGLPIPPRY